MKKLKKILYPLCLIILVFACWNLWKIKASTRQTEELYEKLAQQADSSKSEPQSDTKAEDSQKNHSKNHSLGINTKIQKLQQQNEELVGWLKIDGTVIDYPVMQTATDNDYYLTHDFDQSTNSNGSIFMDERCDIVTPTTNTIIYGHNMKNGSMFAQLKKFSQNDETYKKSKYFWIFTPEKNYRYEIISAYTTGVNSDTYTLFKGPGEEFEKYLEKIKGYSEIKTDAEGLNMKDKIITLSTCTGNEATRYVVQGKRVDTLDVEQ